jgi:hypothetical protein
MQKRKPSALRTAIVHGLATPVFLLGPVFGLIGVAYYWSMNQIEQFWHLTGFTVLALAGIHFVFFACRKLTTEKTLKIVDYFYLGIAFLGIYGILDAQSSVRGSYLAVQTRALIENLIPPLNACTKRDPHGSCAEEDEFVSVLRIYGWSPDSYRWHRGLYEERLKSGKAVADNEFWEVAADFYRLHSEDKTANAVENEIIHRIFLGFYLLSIGLCLRLSKVTVEVFEWYLPKASSFSTVMPTIEPSAQNAT